MIMKRNKINKKHVFHAASNRQNGRLSHTFARIQTQKRRHTRTHRERELIEYIDTLTR